MGAAVKAARAKVQGEHEVIAMAVRRDLFITENEHGFLTHQTA